jgi:hypothetical protein
LETSFVETLPPYASSGDGRENSITGCLRAPSGDDRLASGKRGGRLQRRAEWAAGDQRLGDPMSGWCLTAVSASRRQRPSGCSTPKAGRRCRAAPISCLGRRTVIVVRNAAPRLCGSCPRATEPEEARDPPQRLPTSDAGPRSADPAVCCRPVVDRGAHGPSVYSSAAATTASARCATASSGRAARRC